MALWSWRCRVEIRGGKVLEITGDAKERRTLTKFVLGSL